MNDFWPSSPIFALYMTPWKINTLSENRELPFWRAVSDLRFLLLITRLLQIWKQRPKVGSQMGFLFSAGRQSSPVAQHRWPVPLHSPACPQVQPKVNFHIVLGTGAATCTTWHKLFCRAHPCGTISQGDVICHKENILNIIAFNWAAIQNTKVFSLYPFLFNEQACDLFTSITLHLYLTFLWLRIN